MNPIAYIAIAISIINSISLILFLWVYDKNRKIVDEKLDAVAFFIKKHQEEHEQFHRSGFADYRSAFVRKREVRNG